MSDASSTQTLSAETHSRGESAGHGRHRGPVASQDAESAPHGRHRKPAAETEAAA